MELTWHDYEFTVSVRKKGSRRRKSTDRTPLDRPSAAHSDAKDQHILASGTRYLLPMR